MQRYMVLGALFLLLPVAAQAGGASAPDDTNAGPAPVAMSLKAPPPTIQFKTSQWAMPPDAKAPLAPDKTAQFVDKLLTVNGNVRLEPEGHSDIDVKPPQGQNSDRGAYINLKIDW